MPVPCPPVPGLLGSRPPNHQAFFTATPPYAPAYNAAPPSYAPAYGYALAYGGAPAYAPQQPAWDPALYATLQQAPAPGAYAGGGDWFLDSGASTHMAAHPGNLSHSFPTSTDSRIIVGNGAGLPISHIGSTNFPSSSRPLSLNNVIVSPHLIQNLVSVKALSHDNSVTVEFHASGFSVKDARTRMVLHQCESPGDLYPVQASSTPGAGPRAFSAGVDLWHARLGHPSANTLHQIMRGFSFFYNKKAAHSWEACRVGKHVRLPFSNSSTVASFPFELIHSDVWTFPIPSNSGFVYYLVILDDFSHFVWTFPLRKKSDVATTLTA
jgi:hypothetical protein